MQKLVRTGVYAALAALLIPLLLLSAVGAMRGDAAAEEKPAVETNRAPTTPTNVEPVSLQETPTGYDARQTVRLLTDTGAQTLTLADYLIGVVMGELPASFADAAVAAQVVAARTFALRRMEDSKHDGSLCADAACCQAWIPPEQAAAALGEVYEPWLSRVSAAVAETDGQVLTYDGKLIEAAFFSCSGGRTEDAVAVWGGDVPYLVAVDSPGEEAAPRFSGAAEWTAADFRAAILTVCPDAMLSGTPETWLGEAVRTDGGGVASLEVGGQAIPGTVLRTLLGLNSTNFTVTIQEDLLRFETLGFGHRVGMSQYGANAMAADGATYAQILTHYYTGAELTTLHDLRR